MTSHEYAEHMKAVANFLLSRTAFALPRYRSGYDERFNFFYEKEEFIAAVRALGGRKGADDTYYTINCAVSPHANLQLAADRSAVCKMVAPAQPAVYECEPLLSAREESALEAQ